MENSGKLTFRLFSNLEIKHFSMLESLHLWIVEHRLVPLFLTLAAVADNCRGSLRFDSFDDEAVAQRVACLTCDFYFVGWHVV